MPSMLPSWLQERSHGAPEGALTHEVPPSGRPYSDMMFFCMCLKTMQHEDTIGGDLWDEITITVGDAPWQNKNLWFVAGPSLNNKENQGCQDAKKINHEGGANC